jgi:glycerophosphoryl diester phosphodiesterase
MFECDVKLSADGQLFLLHDADLARTTSGQGLARDLNWDALATLDAGSWFSAAYTGEPLLRLEDLATWLQAHHLMVNLEIKPNPGQEAETGQAVAQAVSRLWAGQSVQPLLSSFQVSALQAAQMESPDLPRALLLEAPRATWLDEAHSLDCVAVVPHHAMLDAAVIAQAHAAGLKVLTYTVNAPERAAALWEAGLNGLITDRVDLFEFEARAERLSGPA